MIEVDVQQALQLEQRRVATHQQLAGLVGENPAFGLAVLVLDVADQHFQHILHGQEADHLVVAFFHQHEMRAALAELLQQAGQRHVLGHPLQRTQQLVQAEMLGQAIVGRQRQQQVLDVQQADVLALDAVIDRVAAVLVAADDFQNLAQRSVVLQLQQVLSGVGPVDDLQFTHLYRRGQHLDLRVARVAGAVGVQDQLELLAAVVMVVVCAWLALAGDAQDGIGAGVEQVDRRVHQPVEQVQRHGRP